MFPMTITLHNEAQLRAVLNAVSNAEVPQPAANPAPKAETKKEAAQVKEPEVKKEEPKAAESAQPVATEKSTEAPTAATSGDKVYTVDDAKALTMKIVPAKGRDAAVGLLQKYGVPVAAKLAPEHIVPFCQEAEQLLAS